MDATANTTAELLSLLLGKALSPDGDVSMETDKAWDSMKHIEIIMTFEERFGVSFEPEDIPRLTSQSLLAAKVRELLDDHPA